MNITPSSAHGAAFYTYLEERATSLGMEAVNSPSRPEFTDPSIAAWDRLIDELLRIRTLTDDWDGEGSVAPDAALVDEAIRWAQDFRAVRVEPADRVIAGVNGTIYFEWHTPLAYQEIEITSPGDAELRIVRKGEENTEVIPLCR